jgi:hypothetical protein
LRVEAVEILAVLERVVFLQDLHLLLKALKYGVL